MQESKDELHATQGNLTEDPNQCSEEPKAKFLPRKASPGASNSYYFQSMQSMLYYYLFVHLHSGVGWNLRCMILGSYNLLPGYID